MVESEIIGNTKKNNEGELIVILFEYCNLACQFCTQDHSSIVGMDTILGKIESVKKALDVLKARGKTKTTINLMGGELFADEVDDRLFDDYLSLIQSITDYGNDIAMPVKIMIATNMVWTRTDRVKTLLDRSGVKINASYDPAGRFNKESLEIFYNRITEFKDYVSHIGVVMTKPNIKKFMADQAPHFEYLYNNFMIVFDNYTQTPGSNLNFLMPLDYELRDFYKFMVDQWPNCIPFQEFSSKLQQNMGCMRTMYVFVDNSFGSCGAYEQIVQPLTEYAGQKTVIMLTKLEQHIETKFFQDYDCLSCEYMSRCSFSCFLNHHIRDSRTQEECWLKEVYQYIDSKNA